jgi:hypothetical protein
MRMLIALLAVALMSGLVELSLGASEAQAAASCRQSYNVCLARCGPNSQRCQRCRTKYKYCTFPMPYMGNLL